MCGLWAKWDVKGGRREVGEPAVLPETDMDCVWSWRRCSNQIHQREHRDSLTGAQWSSQDERLLRL